jgi:hypothetical protein
MESEKLKTLPLMTLMNADLKALLKGSAFFGAQTVPIPSISHSIRAQSTLNPCAICSRLLCDIAPDLRFSA